MIVARWSKGVYNKDQTGASVEQHCILVEEKSMSKSDTNPINGVTTHTWSLVLVSPSLMARKIVAGDSILYLKHRYIVQSTETQDNRLSANGKNTILYMK